MAEGGRGGLTDARRRWAARALAGCAAAAATLLAVPAVTATTAAGATAAAAGGQAAAGEQLLAWGSNRQGDLGDGTTVNRLTPVPVDLPAGTTIAGVAAGTDHSLARTATGRVLAWGANADGELGNGSTAGSDVPVRVPLPAGTRVTSVKAGCYDSLALTSAGRVLAWGKNEFGELGDGTRRSRPAPVLVALPSGTRVRAISAGCFFSLALTTTGQVLAWGRNYGGSLGDGNLNTTSRVPIRVRLPSGIRVTAVTAGGYHGLALTVGGALFGWGYNAAGQVGDGTTTDRDVPVRVHLGAAGPHAKVITVASGNDHTLAVLADGGVLAWGLNDLGQLGAAAGLHQSDVPVKVGLPAGAGAVSAGFSHSMALTASGGILAWGWNHYGQLGNGTTDTTGAPVTVQLAAGAVATALGCGPEAVHCFAIVRADA